MKPIAATVFSESRRDFFWLDASFAMTASSPKRGLGFDLHFGGIFTSVPTAVAAMAPRDPVVSTRGVLVGSAASVSAARAPLGSNASPVTAMDQLVLLSTLAEPCLSPSVWTCLGSASITRCFVRGFGELSTGTIISSHGSHLVEFSPALPPRSLGRVIASTYLASGWTTPCTSRPQSASTGHPTGCA